MLAVGRAIMSDPELLMLDEPSMGLAPLVIAEVFQVIKKVNEMGIPETASLAGNTHNLRRTPSRP